MLKVITGITGALIAASVTAASIVIPTAPAPDRHKVQAAVAWLQQLPAFKKAKLTDPVSDVPASTMQAFGIYAQRLAQPDLAIDLVITGEQLTVTLYVRGIWTGQDSALLRDLAKHFLGDGGEPITEELLEQARQGTPIGERLDRGKIEVDYDAAGASSCPFDGACYLAELSPY